MTTIPFVLGRGRTLNTPRNIFLDGGIRIRKDLVVEQGTPPSEKYRCHGPSCVARNPIRIFITLATSYNHLSSHQPCVSMWFQRNGKSDQFLETVYPRRKWFQFERHCTEFTSKHCHCHACLILRVICNRPWPTSHLSTQNSTSAGLRFILIVCHHTSRSSRTTSIKIHSFRTWDRRRRSTSPAKNRKIWSPTWTNTEIFELCENTSKQQCPDCNATGKTGIISCSCGINKKSTWSRKTAVVEPSTELPKDKICTTMPNKCFKRPDRESMETIQRYSHDSTLVTNTESHNLTSEGENTTSYCTTGSPWRSTSTQLQDPNEFRLQRNEF